MEELLAGDHHGAKAIKTSLTASSDLLGPGWKIAVEFWLRPPIVQSRRCPSSPCQDLLPVNGEKRAGASSALFLQHRRLAKPSTAASLRPVYGEKMAAAR
ncbi:hypothetical protein EB233_13320 [Mesorhizobium erdmanii]|uniref:Uncharacterized protein n=1 Tax=Mesorhizobium erdmanii TaxID=1777866 RepID=A0A6M7UJT1_9HYPH|nr:hypothetical protein EB233_13320 [Mesorhizobium erdmanii]